jgi:hypothetical protein
VSCAEAKRRRDEAEDRMGMKRTYESLQKLGKTVYQACK